MKAKTHEAFPERLRIERARRQWTQREVAKAIHVDQVVISYWEHGHRLPSIVHLGLLADLFDCTTDYLLGRHLDP